MCRSSQVTVAELQIGANVHSREVSQQSHKTWNDLPGFLRWRPSDPDTNDSSVLVPLYLNFLYNDFLLYRVLVRRAQSGSEGLVSVSQNILSTILELIGKEIGSRTGTYNVGYNVRAVTPFIPALLCLPVLRLPLSVFQRPAF